VLPLVLLMASLIALADHALAASEPTIGPHVRSQPVYYLEWPVNGVRWLIPVIGARERQAIAKDAQDSQVLLQFGEARKAFEVENGPPKPAVEGDHTEGGEQEAKWIVHFIGPGGSPQLLRPQDLSGELLKWVSEHLIPGERLPKDANQSAPSKGPRDDEGGAATALKEDRPRLKYPY
jgi:hypothetical protein